jgi:hypothetical protein
MPAWVAPAIGAAANWIGGLINKPDKFEDTPQGKRLKYISQHGSVSPGQRSIMLGNISKETGNIASQAKADFSGRLVSQGMGGSIAGQEKLADIDAERMKPITEMSERLDMLNEQSKMQAADEFAQGQTMSDQAIKQNKAQTWGGLIGGIGQAVGAGFSENSKLKGQVSKWLEAFDNGEISQDELFANMLQSNISMDEMYSAFPDRFQEDEQTESPNYGVFNNFMKQNRNKKLWE